MNLVSYAQNQEDILLYRALRGIDKGFYIDVGAQHPVADSVTKLFYERGWHGINIDPVPQWFELLREDRPHDVNLRMLVGSVAGREKFYVVAGTGLSTADATLVSQYAELGYTAEELEVETRTLDDICAEHHVGTVHFLKVDVEGAEEEVLRGFSFRQIRPWVVLVEAVAPVAMREGDDAHIAVETHAGWEPILIEHGYEHVYSDGLNRFYVAKEHVELKVLLSTQSNPLDAFVRHEELLKHERILELDAKIRELTDVSEIIDKRYQARDFQSLVETAENRLNRIAVLEQDNARLVGEASVLQHSAAELKDASIELSAARLETIELCKQIANLRSELHQSEAIRQQMLSSRSWRWTALLRDSRKSPVSSSQVKPEASAATSQGKSRPRRAGRRFLLACLRFSQHHPRLRGLVKAGCRRVPVVNNHLSAFVQHNLVPAKSSPDPASDMADPGPAEGNLEMPSEVGEVHRRIRRVITDQRHQKD